MPDAEQGHILLTLARNAIASRLGLPKRETHVQNGKLDWLNKPGASFVTLTINGNLRGCIGSLEAKRVLSEDVIQNALAAAFQDPRFTPLTQPEFANMLIEVSLLSPQQAITFDSETDALAQLRPHLDGLVLEYEHHRSTFLPQVWAQLPKPEQFMLQLKQKAGLANTFWSPDIKLYRYTVEKWKESAEII